jgi:hypothetical protein
MTCSLVHAVRTVLFLLSFLIQPTVGQNSVTATQNADATALANLIVDPAVTGVTVTKAVLTGNAAQFGVYSKTGTLFPNLPCIGAVLSSGRVINVRAGGSLSAPFGGSGDTHLDTEVNKIKAGAFTRDAAVLVIDVSVSAPVSLTISYVFGSAEYPAGNFPDIFGLFVDNVNVALIGGKPVSAETVRCSNNGVGPSGPNCIYYINNPLRAGTFFSGYTTTQVLTLNLSVGSHTLKVAVADGSTSGDSTVDSAVFLAFPAPCPTKSPTQSPTMSPTRSPTMSPTMTPTSSPTRSPTMNPTMKPTRSPTQSPTRSPTRSPTMSPTMNPTMKPTRSPTQSPTRSPTMSPTMTPTSSPTRSPTMKPTMSPTMKPTRKPTLPPMQVQVPIKPPMSGKMAPMTKKGKGKMT